MQISNLATNYPLSGIRQMFVLGAQHPGYVNLCNGEPDFFTPQNIKDAACKAILENQTKYAPAAGTPNFRQSVADKYTRQFGKTYTQDNVCASLGGVEGVMMSLMAIINPGDEVIIPDPSYTCYPGQVELLGGKVVRVPLYEEDGFTLTPQTLQKYITPKTKAVILNYPNNPVGAMLTMDKANALAKVIAEHKLYVISDEVYEAIVFDGREHLSLAQVDLIADQVIVVNSLSKTYAMTGWRIGYVLANEQVIANIAKMQEPLAACLPTFILEAGAEALNGPQDAVHAMREEYAARRELLVKGLSTIDGLKVFQPEGSFCTFVGIKDLGLSSDTFAKRLISEGGVLTCGGNVFGKMGEGYLRVCFANSQEAVIEGVKRISNFVNTL